MFQTRLLSRRLAIAQAKAEYLNARLEEAELGVDVSHDEGAQRLNLTLEKLRWRRYSTHCAGNIDGPLCKTS